MSKVRAAPKKFTAAEDQFLRDNYLSIPAKRMGAMLGRNESTARTRLKRLGIVVPAEVAGKFKQLGLVKKGMVHPNKGKKLADFMSAEAIEKIAPTRFKPGQKPHNTLYDAAITIRLDNRGRLYKWIRLAEGKWQPLHIYNWNKAGKTIPPGYLLRFISDNTLNADVSNLELISKAKNLDLNRKARKLTATAKAVKSNSKKLRNKILRDERKVQMRQQKKQEAEKIRLQKKQLRLQKKQEAEDLRQQKKKQLEQKERQMAIEQHRQMLRKKERSPAFQTRQLDYTSMVAVRIDAKTIIYAKPEEDVDQVRNRYLSRLAGVRMVVNK